MQKARRSLKDALKKIKFEKIIDVPIYSDMNMIHKSNHQADLYLPKLSPRVSPHSLLLNELPLSGREHKNLAFQTELF